VNILGGTTTFEGEAIIRFISIWKFEELLVQMVEKAIVN
jgi:hypothetical protein